jgi:hypothetical protein
VLKESGDIEKEENINLKNIYLDCKHFLMNIYFDFLKRMFEQNIWINCKRKMIKSKVELFCI